VAKKDGSVFLEAQLEATTTTTHSSTHTIDQFCDFTTWKPTSLMQKYKEDRGCFITQGGYFKHVTNFVARSHAKNNNDLVPSSHLDLCITRYVNRVFYSCFVNLMANLSLPFFLFCSDQIVLLNPNFKDLVLGRVLDDCLGDGAKKKLAKRQVDIITGNISSYSRVVNSQALLDLAVEANDIAAVIGEIRADNEEGR